MQNKESFSISPGTNIMEVLGHSGYSFNYAIADLIDNCLAAKATEVLLYLDIVSTKPYIYILDNGQGMSLTKLKEAAIIGFEDITKERSIDDLGRFSTGLKSAAKSFCDNIFICSKQQNQPANTIQLDFKHIRNSKKWEAFVVSNPEFSNKIIEHGTIIICDDLTILDQSISTSNVYSILEDLECALSHIYCKYLLENKLKLTIQLAGSKPNLVTGWNPFGLLHNRSTKKVYHSSIEYKGASITICGYVLPVFSNLDDVDQRYMNGRGLIDQQGFYVFRNGRLIHEGGWLNLQGLSLDEKSKYARIEICIPSTLDESFKINFSKNTLVVPVELQKVFKEIALKVRKESRESANYLRHPELKRKLKSDETKVWQTSHSSSGTVLSINPEHPLVKRLTQSLSIADRNKFFQLLSKTIPVRMIQEQDMRVGAYSEQEIMELTDGMYQSLKSQGLSLSEIKKKIASLEPFKEHLNTVIDYFDKLEDRND